MNTIKLYPRENGTGGVRNRIAVISTVACANHVAEQIAAQNEAWADERIEEAEKQVQMQAVLKSRNLDSLAAILSENGKKHLAKNTTLLTTYDRRGRIVAIDEAERERILHGDKNFIKL